MMPSRNENITCTMLLVALLLFATTIPSHAQSFGDATALMQSERIARVTTLLDDTLYATPDTTAWLAFGTHSEELASQRSFAPTRFTLFAWIDTTGGIAGADPEITLEAQLALTDTTLPYTQWDGSLELVPSSAPIEEVGGFVLPVPVYGGGYLRLIATSVDTARVKLDLWRVR